MSPSAPRSMGSVPLFALVGAIGAAISLGIALVLVRLVSLSGIDLTTLPLGPEVREMVVTTFAFAGGTAVAAAVITHRFLGCRTPLLGFPPRPGAGTEVLLGLALGGVPALLVGIAYIVIGADVSWSVDGAASFGAIAVLGAILFVPAAMAEEWLFREYAFTALVPHLGPVATVVLTSAVFALVHVPNPGEMSVFGVLDIFVAGVGLGLAYLWTGSLWLPTAWHASWNAFLGSGLGLSVSGYEIPSLLDVAPRGARWWTGGAFGPEAALPGLLVDTLALLVFLAVARKVPRPNWSGAGGVDMPRGRL